ncbi:hypothetical protein ASF22_20785 [Methylobacterium sp. Leaf87]|nr:hypothetical protein ASF22_20785 [Methylobacterium sp. Leaf87]
MPACPRIVAHDAGAPANEASGPRLIQLLRTDVTACDDAPDWAEISVGFGSLDPAIASELWGLIVVPRTMHTFDPAEVTFVDARTTTCANSDLSLVAGLVPLRYDRVGRPPDRSPLS